LMDDVRCACTSDLKTPGDAIYLLGETRAELGGSLYAALGHAEGFAPPGQARHGPAIARVLHRAIVESLVAACHDCSEGGLGVALAEMAMAGDLGAEVHVASMPWLTDQAGSTDMLLFSESNGRYLVEVRETDRSAFESLIDGLPSACIGHVTAGRNVTVYGAQTKAPEFTLALEAIESAWRGHIAPVPAAEALS